MPRLPSSWSEQVTVKLFTETNDPNWTPIIFQASLANEMRAYTLLRNVRFLSGQNDQIFIAGWQCILRPWLIAFGNSERFAMWLDELKERATMVAALEMKKKAICIC